MLGGHLPGQRPGCLRVTCGVADTSVPVESPTAELRIITLGEFAVRSARFAPRGTPRWGRDESRKLLKCLLAASSFRRTREQLMALLWPDYEPVAARAALRHALSRLRHTLEPDSTERASVHYVGSDREAIWLQCGPSPASALTDAQRDSLALWIDRQEFERKAAIALAACTAVRDDPSWDVAAQHARHALRLYRGAFLPNDLYVDWTQPARDRCRHLWASLVRRFSVLMAVREGDYEQAGLLLERMAEAMPDDENTAALLMLVQAVGGHRREALRTYEALRQRLKQHFDIEPSGELEAVAASIRAGGARSELMAFLAVGTWERRFDLGDEHPPLDLRELAYLASAT